MANGGWPDFIELQTRFGSQAGDLIVPEPLRNSFVLKAPESFHLGFLPFDVSFVFDLDLDLIGDLWRE